MAQAPRTARQRRLSESERAFQQKVVQTARLTGWLTYHTYDSRRSDPGFPDLVLVRGAELIFWECKTETGRLSPEQQDWLAALTAAGQEARVIRPSDFQGYVVPRLQRRHAA